MIYIENFTVSNMLLIQTMNQTDTGRIFVIFWIIISFLLHKGFCDIEDTTESDNSVSTPGKIRDSYPTNTYKGDLICEMSGNNQGLPTTPPGTIRLDSIMKNMTKYTAETIRIKCEISGDPLPAYNWYKDNRAMEDIENEDARYEARPTVWGSRLRIKNLRESDSGIYRCEGENRWGKQSTEAALIVLPGTNPNKNSKPGRDSSNYDTETEDDDDNISYYDNETPGLQPPIIGPGWNPNSGNGKGVKSGSSFCQTYRGLACSKFIGQKTIFVRSKEQQSQMEKTMTAALATIASVNVMSEECGQYAIPTLCYNAFPLCDESASIPTPKKICKDECLTLENSICKKEFDMARGHHVLSNNVVLPKCEDLPEPNSPEGAKCQRIGIHPVKTAPVQKEECYNRSGESYRGTIHTTVSGYTCQKWSIKTPHSHYFNLETNPELGDHNYCRNPDNSESGPWCFTTDSSVRKELCPVPKCVVHAEKKVSEIVMILVPSIVVPVGLALLLVAVCMCRRNKGNSSINKPHPKQQAHPVEMNALLSKQHIRAREFPMSSIRFIQEMGEGTFGKVYRGELLGYYSDNTITNVVIKTADTKTQHDFRKEVEVMTDMKHPNIICMLGVCLKEHPNSMLFEFLCNGDLHNYLNIHSPRNELVYNESIQILGYHELLHIATQVASGMEYLASHRYVHRDLAARNILVGENLIVKISDFGLAKNIYTEDYYRVQNVGLLPVRWMPLEAMYGTMTVESDVWSYGVLVWEIFSYGLQPYYGYKNEEVINMIRARQILPCPEECPPCIYALMIECWHEMPIRRPTFKEIHKRLIQWKADAIMNHPPASHLASTTTTTNYGQLGAAAPAPSQSSNNSGQHSYPPSHHSSTGPSNNTATTCLTGSGHTPPGQNVYVAYPHPSQQYHPIQQQNNSERFQYPPMSMPYPPTSINGMYRPMYGGGLYKKPSPPGSVSSHKSSSVQSSVSPESSVSNCKMSSNHSGSGVGGYGFPYHTTQNGHLNTLPEQEHIIDSSCKFVDCKPSSKSNDSGMYIPDMRTSDI